MPSKDYPLQRPNEGNYYLASPVGIRFNFNNGSLTKYLGDVKFQI